MSGPLTSFERAARLFIAAEKLGCDTPTENMIADAIQDAEFDTLHNPRIIAERHDQDLTSVGKAWTALGASCAACLKHAATLLRASRYALKHPEMDHAGFYDSVEKILAVIEFHCESPPSSTVAGAQAQDIPEDFKEGVRDIEAGKVTDLDTALTQVFDPQCFVKTEASADNVEAVLQKARE